MSKSPATAAEAITFLSCQDVHLRKGRSNVQTTLAVQTVESTARSVGLPAEQIIQVVDLATSKTYADSTAAKLIKSLIPTTTIPALAVVKAVSSICTNKLSANLQGLLLRWIVIIYNLIDKLADVHSMYSILFLFLESDVLCPHTCHLLYYLTKREDVKYFRVKKLLDLQNRIGAQPHLAGLLSVYKMYCPHFVAMPTIASTKEWFKQTDKAWRGLVQCVQSKNGSLVPVDRLFFTVRSKSVKRKRSGSVIMPLPKTMPLTRRPEKSVGLPVEQVSSFKQLLKNFDNVELPSQIGSVLESPYLQHIISCSPDPVVFQRLDYWLDHSLREALLCDGSTLEDPSTVRLLQALVQLTAFLQEPISPMESCLAQYLPTWNGVDYRLLVLQMIAHIGLHPFQKLNDFVLEPIRKLFFYSSVYIKCQVMYCFTELLHNFANVELARLEEFVEPEKSTVQEMEMESSTLTADDADSFDPLQTIYEFVQFVDRMCVVGLQAEKDHTLLQHWVLSFFEVVSTLHQNFTLPFVLIPSPGIVYRMLFSCNAAACSRMCQIIVNYKNAFESLKKAQQQSKAPALAFPDGFQSIKSFNQYILDICDSLWRKKAFVEREKSFAFSIPSSVTDSLGIRHINEAFSIHNNMALIGYAWEFLHQTQPKDMKLNPSLIKGGSRNVYLEFMKHQNLHGIVQFLDTFIRQRMQTQA